MTKLELNDKLAGLYNFPKSIINVTSFTSKIIDGKQKDTFETDYILIIDCWNVLMDLAVDNGLLLHKLHTNESAYAVKVKNSEIFGGYASYADH